MAFAIAQGRIPASGSQPAEPAHVEMKDEIVASITYRDERHVPQPRTVPDSRPSSGS